MISFTSTELRPIPARTSRHGKLTLLRVRSLAPALLTEPALIVKSLGPCKRTSTKFCRFLGSDAEILQERKHVLAEGLVVFVDDTPVLGFAAHFWFTGASQNRAKD